MSESIYGIPVGVPQPSNSVGRKTVEGGEIFNDYENNFAGTKGFYISNISDISGKPANYPVEIGTPLKIKLAYAGDGSGIDTKTTADDIKSIISSVGANLIGAYVSLNLYSLITNSNGDQYCKPYCKCATIENAEINDNDIVITIKTNTSIPYEWLAYNSEKGHDKDGNIITGSNTLSCIWATEHPFIGTEILYGYSHAEGCKNKSNGDCSHTEGAGNIADGHYGHAEGENNFAAYACHAEGRFNIADGENTHIEGVNNTGKGYNVHIEGDNNKSTGSSSHTEGTWNGVSSRAGHAEGWDNRVSGVAGHAEGKTTQAVGDHSHSEGAGTKAIGENAHTEGKNVRAHGVAAHAEGINTDPNYYTENAYGEASHTEGTNCSAYATNGHAGGNGSVVGIKDQPNIAKNAFARGNGVKATRYNNEVALGNYNLEEDNAIFTIGNGYWGNLGNGRDGLIRKNAVVVKQSNPNCSSYSITKAWMEVESQGNTPKSVVIKSTLDKLLTALENITTLEDIKAIAKSIREEIGG